MKVRHRSNGYKDWKVLEESDTFYIAEGDFAPLALKKREYVPVQEWVPIYTFEMCGMKGKEIRAVHSGNGFITVEVKR